MIGCYIIFSKSLNKFYVGATQDNLEGRILKHNNHEYGNNRFTATANDWELFIFIPTDTYKLAVRLERKIKSMKSSLFITNLKKHPEIIEKLKLNLTSN